MNILSGPNTVQKYQEHKPMIDKIIIAVIVMLAMAIGNAILHVTF